jgi:hypothetical protein
MTTLIGFWRGVFFSAGRIVFYVLMKVLEIGTGNEFV